MLKIIKEEEFLIDSIFHGCSVREYEKDKYELECYLQRYYILCCKWRTGMASSGREFSYES